MAALTAGFEVGDVVDRTSGQGAGALAEMVAMRDGDIILVHSPWWLRWLMKYYHAAIVWNAGPALFGGELWFTIEAKWPKVGCWALHNYNRPYDVFRPVSRFDTPLLDAFSRLGERYSIKQALQVLWRCLLKKLGRPLPLAVACSPLVARAWGLNAFTPDEIAEELEGRQVK